MMVFPNIFIIGPIKKNVLAKNHKNVIFSTKFEVLLDYSTEFEH